MQATTPSVTPPSGSATQSWFSKIFEYAKKPMIIVFIFVVLFIIGISLAFYFYAPSNTIPFVSTIFITLLVGISIITLAVFAKTKGNITSRIIYSLYFFMPYALFTFGIVHDIVSARIQYIPATLAGITGMLFNYSLSSLYPQVPVTNALCEIPGLAVLSSSFAPQSMMATLSSLAYIATYATRSNFSTTNLKFANEAGQIWPAWAFLVIVYFLQFFVLIGSGCINRDNASKLGWGLFLPLVWGGAFGLASFALLDKPENPSQGSGGMPSASSSSENAVDCTMQGNVATCAKGSAGEAIVEDATK